MDLHAACVGSMRSYFIKVEKSSTMLAECTAKPLTLRKRLRLASQGVIEHAGPLDVSERQESSAQCGSAWLQFFWLVEAAFPPAGRTLLLAACRQEHNAANERHGARDRRQRDIMCLVASRVNRSDVDDRFPGGVRKTSPRKTEQAKHDQDNSKRFVHNGLPWPGCLTGPNV